MIYKSTLSTVIAAVLFSNIAYSQQEAQDQQENRGYEEVIVTAQKREQALVDVPIAISVLDKDLLDKTRAKTIKEIESLVPNFSFESVNGFSNISIRGVGGGGRNIGFDPRSGLYIDGVYIGQASALAQPLFGIKQVEVLRGPQGHLFGRNTVSGAVSLTSEAPSDEYKGEFKAVVGNEGTYEGYVTVEGALSDSTTARVSAAYETRDGFDFNEFTNEEINDLQRKTIRGQLSFDMSDSLTLDLYADYSKTETTKAVGEAQTGGAAAGSTQFPTPPRRINTNVSPQDDNEVGGVSFTFNYDLANESLLTLISAFRYSQQDRINDTDYSPLDLINIKFDDEYKQISHELRLTSPSDRSVRYVAGLYYISEDASTLRLAHVGSTFVPNPFDISIDSSVDTSAFAAFTSIDADLTENLILNFGLRYTNETKDLTYSLTNGPALGLGVADNLRDEISVSKTTPTIGLTLAVNDDINLYAKYSTGFKSGGFNVGFVSQQSINDGIDFKEETVDSYEIGMKGVLADGSVHFDIAAFRANYSDFQILQFVEVGDNLTDIQLRNAAEVKTSGVEASVTWETTDNFRLGMNFGYLNAEFDSFPDAAGIGVDYTGNELPNAPKLTGALTADYSMSVANGRLDFYGEYSYRDSSFSLANNDSVFALLKSRSLYNMRIMYRPVSGKWALGLWSRNLFNKDFVSLRGRDFLGNEFISRGDPRTFGLEYSIYF
jgi:iron complex outermembrane receptor protein